MSGYTGKTVWIIGASSGIGRTLAVELARRGARLAVSARDGNALTILCAELGADHHALPFDVTDATAAGQAAATITKDFPHLDAVLFMAGQYQPMAIDALDMGAVSAIIATNLTGAFNVVHAALPILLRQKSGQLALCASVAGYRGLPHGQPYGATKAAVINLAESLRADLIGRGIDVRVINPGFVRTRLTDKNNFKMPMMIEPAQAAAAIADGLLTRRFEIHFPRRFTWLVKVLALLPAPLYFRLVRA